MKTLKTQIDKNGRILIPVEIRKKYNMNPGDSFILETEKESIRLMNIDTAVDAMHSIFFKNKSVTKTHSIVDDFLSKKKQDFDIETQRSQKHEK